MLGNEKRVARPLNASIIPICPNSSFSITPHYRPYFCADRGHGDIACPSLLNDDRATTMGQTERNYKSPKPTIIKVINKCKGCMHAYIIIHNVHLIYKLIKWKISLYLLSIMQVCGNWAMDWDKQHRDFTREKCNTNFKFSTTLTSTVYSIQRHRPSSVTYVGPSL